MYKKAEGSTWSTIGGWILVLIIMVIVLALILQASGALDVGFIKSARSG